MKKNKDENLQQKVDFLALKRLFIRNENNEKVYFSSLWEQSQVIIIFIRHFGCPSCKAHVSDIWAQKDKLKDKRIVFIGNGQPNMIKSFKEEIRAPDAEIYTDPSLETFEACGLKKGLRYLVNFKSMKSMMALKKKGYHMSEWEDGNGDKTQMGGILAFKDPGLLTYHYVSEYLADFDETEQWPGEN